MYGYRRFKEGRSITYTVDQKDDVLLLLVRHCVCRAFATKTQKVLVAAVPDARDSSINDPSKYLFSHINFQSIIATVEP